MVKGEIFLVSLCMGVLKTADMGYTIVKTVPKLVKSQHLVCHDIGIL